MAALQSREQESDNIRHTKDAIVSKPNLEQHLKERVMTRRGKRGDCGPNVRRLEELIRRFQEML
jgi:hypothetical protein